MLWFLITVLLIAIGIVVLYYFLHTRYYKFVRINSKAIKEVIKLNKNYRFEVIDNQSLSHSYDNEKMFDNVSCYDYLVYELQFPNNRQMYLDIINRVDKNKRLYDDYMFHIRRIQLGYYEIEPVKYNVDRLLKIELKMFQEHLLSPITTFKLYVTLYWINMAGNLLSTKEDSFDEYQVCHIIDLLKDRSGKFYNNREIWNSLCRVERAKVSNKMRFSIYERDGYRCRMCHRRYDPEYLEIDHIYPIAKGGKSTYDNLQTLCRRCNKEKGDKVL